ncbi:uncharacterized protein [Chelonus insularis]|uniref:uncharacterized protein n=1 Tax=Chelonus insularis TaxID=460826 RepID=UPI001589A2BE|nr:uncharacterized protein LOC118068221 [Chelonus insularis]
MHVFILYYEIIIYICSFKVIDMLSGNTNELTVVCEDQRNVCQAKQKAGKRTINKKVENSWWLLVAQRARQAISSMTCLFLLSHGVYEETSLLKVKYIYHFNKRRLSTFLREIIMFFSFMIDAKMNYSVKIYKSSVRLDEIIGKMSKSKRLF